MLVLRKSDVLESVKALAKLGADYVQCDDSSLFYIHPEANCIDLEYPPKLERLPFFARLLGSIGYNDAAFQGAWLWFTTWGVWNLSDEAIGYQTVEAMNRAAGQPVAFEAAPGHHFRADELNRAVALLMQPMVFGWDAYYLPHWSFGHDEYFLHVSHDSFVTVVTRSAAFYEKVFASLQELDFQPMPGNDLQRRRFCRAE